MFDFSIVTQWIHSMLTSFMPEGLAVFIECVAIGVCIMLAYAVIAIIMIFMERKVDFKEIVHTEGDSFARYMVRMEEIMESMNIIEQLIDNIPEGAFQQKMKPIIRVPEGSYYAAVEGSRGEFGVFLESRGDKYPYRLKFRATGLPLVSAMETMCRGAKIADLIAIGGTVDYVVPDIDR